MRPPSLGFLAFEMFSDTPSPRRHIKTLEQSTPLICGLLEGSVPSPLPTALASPLYLLPVTPFPLSPHTLEGLPPPWQMALQEALLWAPWGLLRGELRRACGGPGPETGPPGAGER